MKTVPEDSKILEWIDAQRQRMIDRVVSLVSTNSHTLNLPGLSEVAAVVEADLRSLGAEVCRQALDPMQSVQDDGTIEQQTFAPAIHARKRSEAAVQVFLGIHIDTVYPIDHAFQKVTRVDEHTLRGPGVLDAKGGLVVLLTALEALEQCDCAGELGWEVLINTDEELGSPGSARLLRECAGRNHYGLVYEPAMEDGKLAGARKGSGNFTIVVRGRAAHAGRDFERGRSAIVSLARIVDRLHAINGSMSGVTVNVGRMHGGGAVNVVPDFALARVNVRISEPRDEPVLRQRFGQIIEDISQRDGVQTTIHGEFLSPPKPLDARSLQLFERVRLCGAKLEQDIAWKLSGGTCDGNKLAAAGLAVVDSLGPCGGKIHSPDEFLLVDSLTEKARLSLEVLRSLALRR